MQAILSGHAFMTGDRCLSPAIELQLYGISIIGVKC
ncbi:hypothetical protein J2S89_001775 [Arthrobacter bambusae]|nr:hypothetical protein [Arthrobacter bambusae]MDQ0097529.1 hypothetical protein [Arthrobacter bambusae]